MSGATPQPIAARRKQSSLIGFDTAADVKSAPTTRNWFAVSSLSLLRDENPDIPLFKIARMISRTASCLQAGHSPGGEDHRARDVDACPHVVQTFLKGDDSVLVSLEGLGPEKQPLAFTELSSPTVPRLNSPA